MYLHATGKAIKNVSEWNVWQSPSR